MVLATALNVTSFCKNKSQSSSASSQIVLCLDGSWMFSAFVLVLLRPRDANASHLPAALMACERFLASCSDLPSLNKISCLQFWRTIQDPMFCDGSSWAIASARVLFLVDTCAQQPPSSPPPPLICCLVGTFLSDRHGIRLADLCRSLVLPFYDSAYSRNWLWPICFCRDKNGKSEKWWKKCWGDNFNHMKVTRKAGWLNIGLRTVRVWLWNANSSFSLHSGPCGRTKISTVDKIKSRMTYV